MDQGNQQALEQFIGNDMYADIDPLTAEISNLVSLQLRVAGEEYDNAVNQYEQTRLIMIIVIVVAIFLGVLFAYVTIRIINHQIKLIKESVKKDAFGRVSIKPIQVVNKDELGLLADTLNVMTGQVRSFVENTHVSAKEIAKGAMDQAKETEAGAREIDFMSARSYCFGTGEAP